ncbi:MAG: hypothetical protein MUE36_06620 [Acidimicrobiales bacterium]|jgi:hypothetical protein|nr:hypothetical protein [Acidimicrobiales bacterium]
MTDAAPPAPEASPDRPTRRLQPRHAGYAVLVAIVVVAVYLLVQLAGDPSTNLAGGSIERLIPAPDSKILQQDQIGIDLAPGYEAELAVNGTPLPLDEVLAVPQLSQVFFQPGPGKAIEFWPAGRNCIVATFWRTETGPAQSSNTSWCFSVV